MGLLTFEEKVGTLTELEELLNNDLQKRLILINDDVNSLDWVVESLMKVCRHSAEQAEQCALITHTKGKYAVKTAPMWELLGMKEGLETRGLLCEIDE